jgi:hypothetical protein
VFDVPDLLPIHALEDRSRAVVPLARDRLLVKEREVQVSLLERETHLQDKLKRRAHVTHHVPKIIAHGQLTKIHSELAHSANVKLEMLLLLGDGPRDSRAEAGRRLGELEQHQRHELHREKLVVCKKMQDSPAGGVLGEMLGELRLADLRKCVRTSRKPGHVDQCAAGRIDARRILDELVVPGGAQKNTARNLVEGH